MRFIYLLLIFFSSCQLIPTNSVNNSTATNQTELDQQFINNIKNRKYNGFVDIWGGGALRLNLVIDNNGCISNSMIDWDPTFFIMHKFYKALSPTNAYYYMPYSASYTLADTMYEIVVNGDEIYRTTSAWGLTKNDKPTSRQNPGWLYTEDYQIQHNGVDELMTIGTRVKEFPTSRSMPNQKASQLQQQGYSQEEIYNILKN